MKLLACIAFHYDLARVGLVESVMTHIANYSRETHVYIDSNESCNLFTNVHYNLRHPFHLTWVHRKMMKAKIDLFDWFMYCESDMLLKRECFEEYTKHFHDLWALNYVPSFIRIETANGKEYITDMTEPQVVREHDVVTIKGKRYITLNKPYHAFWIMPQDVLKATMKENFVRLEENRELAASYPMWELMRTPLVRITDDNKIHPLCYSYHLANNYATNPDTEFGKIEVDKVLI